MTSSRYAASLLFSALCVAGLFAQAPTRDEIRQMVREVLREELRSDATGATEEGLRSIVREEMRQLLESDDAVDDDRVRGLIREVMSENEDHERLDSKVKGLLARMGSRGPFVRDELFRIRMTGLMQFRYTFTRRKDEPERSAFKFPRARLQWDGDLTDELSFHVRGGFTGLQRRQDGFEQRNGEFQLENFFATYRIEDNVVLTLGQASFAIMREELIGSHATLGADYGLMYSAFTPAKSKGVQVTITEEVWRLNLSYNTGVRTVNTFLDSSENADFAIAGRFEYLAGEPDWTRFDDFTSWNDSELAALFGIGITYEDGARISPGDPEFELLYVTVDIGVEGDGWNAFLAFAATYTDVFLDRHTFDWGLQVQGGVFVHEQFEIFARGGAIFAGSERDLDDLYEATLGINFYKNPRDFNERITLEIVYVIGEVNDSFVPVNENAGSLSSDEDGQFSIRLQWQIVF